MRDDRDERDVRRMTKGRGWKREDPAPVQRTFVPRAPAATTAPVRQTTAAAGGQTLPQPGGSPIVDGAEYDAMIESVGSKGDGIAKIMGFVVFVKDAKVGERLKIKITKVAQTCAFAVVVQRIG